MGEEEEIFDDEGEDNQEKKPLLNADGDAPTKRGVNALHLTMMIYFFTSGGPFGIEAAVGAAGPLLTLISLVVIPMLWSLPQALMSAELALMMSENGGNVLWVQRAFGDFLGWWNAFANLICSFSSMGLLVVLFVLYIPEELTWWEEWGIKIGFVIFLTVINILGLRWISRLSVFFIIFLMAPFAVEAVYLIIWKEFNWDILAQIPPFKDVHWGLFLSTVIWSYGGFDSMGSLAGEVKGGRATYIAGIAGSMPLIIANYFFPLIMGWNVSHDRALWTSGYFTKVAYKFSRWLGAWTVAASALSNFGQYNAAMAPLSRVIWAMAKGKAGGKQFLPSFLALSHRRHTGTIRPIAAVVFTGLMSAIVSALPFNILVQIFLVVRILNLGCEYGALIKLKYSEPDVDRPFKVPGGNFGAIVLGLPTLGLATFCLIYADWQAWAYGGAAHVIIVISYFIKLLVEKIMNKKQQQNAIN